MMVRGHGVVERGCVAVIHEGVGMILCAEGLEVGRF